MRGQPAQPANQYAPVTRPVKTCNTCFAEMNSNVSFSVEEDMALVEYLNLHFCLHNVNEHAQKKDYDVDETSWEEISDHLNKRVDVCKKRWRMIQSAQEENKINHELSTESEATNDPAELLVKDNQSFVAPTSETQEIINIPSNQNYVEQGNATANATPSLEEESKKSTETNQNKSLVESKKNEKKDMNTLPEAEKYDDDVDHIDAFFRSLAESVMEFPLDLRINAKLKVIRILSRMEVLNFRLKK